MMAIFEWTDDYSVGVHTIDTQHQGLFKTFNDLHDALTGGDKGAIEKALGDMWQYTTDHFEYEEKYFRMHKYPDTEAHKAEHAALSDQVAEKVRQYHAGDLELTTELTDFLGNWLKTHILQTDKQYSEFFRSKGVR